MQNSFLFFNIISFDFYTLRPTLFQFFYPLGKVGSFKYPSTAAITSQRRSDENVFPPNQILRFRNKNKSEGAESGE